MFGYVVTSSALADEDKARYRGFYCGLCAVLKEKYGNTGRLTLSYDMTFLSLVLTALYELQEQSFDKRCPVHPARPKHFCLSEATDYCADMNLVLAYYKAADDWLDDKRVSARVLLRQLEQPYRAIEQRYPDKCAVIKACLEEMHRVEASGEEGLDRMCNLTGQMLGEIYAWRNDHWQPLLRQMGEGLGRFIYLMDAYDDLRRDQQKNRFNPLMRYVDRPDFEDLIQSSLTLMIAEGVEAFEQLPILQDLSILRNVLYSGVWSRYAHLQKKRTKEQHHGT